MPARCQQFCTTVLHKAREKGNFVGFSFTSDESPASADRYAALRFQITWVHTIIFVEMSRWDDIEYEFAMPFIPRQFLCDIVNCPGKTGTIVYEVIVKQWWRFGLTPAECMSGVGDGGGENEGASGVHACIESRNDSYVRRRCLLHLPWRVADQGLAEMGELHDETKAISQYLHDGPTWQRLKSIATQSPRQGGLGLMLDASPAYSAFFSASPPSNQKDRPATTCYLLTWLSERSAIMGRLVRKDLEQRRLTSGYATMAVPSLQNPSRCVLRRVSAVLLSKALFLFFYTQKKQHVALHDNLNDLFKKAASIITDLRIDKYVMKQLAVTEERIIGFGFADGSASASWVELAVRMEQGITDGDRAVILDEAQAFHTRCSLRMVTHLTLGGKNIERTTWLSARLRDSSSHGAYCMKLGFLFTKS